VIFIDLARALAVILMIAGHTSSALLDSSYRGGRWFDLWMFQRGLTSALFLLLSGFAFSIATSRHWSAHVKPSRAVWHRLRRLGLLIVLGYGLHFPVAHFSELVNATDAQWRAFLVVDVLQCIGATFVLIQLLVMVVRTRRIFTTVAFAIAVALIAVAPAVWRREWVPDLPLVVAQYLSPATGSLFPLVPWSAFILFGAAIGQFYARWGASHLRLFATWGLLVPGIAVSAIVFSRGWGDSGASQPFDWLRWQVVSDIGVCLVILGLVAHASDRVTQLPRIVGAVAQESLVIYFVHLCLVYGSVWNRGLYQFYAESLSLPMTLLAVAGVSVPMIALAWQWNWLKHSRPGAARWIAAAVGGLLVVRLL
jgi:uncharacterized membrane protein